MKVDERIMRGNFFEGEFMESKFDIMNSIYNHKLKRIDELMAVDPAPFSRDGWELQRLVAQVQRYEEKYIWRGKTL